MTRARQSTKKRDLSGTVRCTDCGVGAEHERGPGTPLVLRHKPGCQEYRLPTKATDDIAAATLEAIEELAARWHRARATIVIGSADPSKNNFTFGRMEGYCQGIALLLGKYSSEIKHALEAGQL
jgi:hypothetical protein